MMQTIVELLEEQIAALARFCRKAGVTQEEAIRQAVEKLIAGGESVEVSEDLRVGFGLWRGRSLDGRTYVEACRAEWEEREQAIERRRGA